MLFPVALITVGCTFILASTAPVNPTNSESRPKKPKLATEARCNPKISEINLDLASPHRGKEFIEIQLNCQSRPGVIPKNVLKGYKVVVIKANPMTVVALIDCDVTNVDIGSHKKFVVIGGPAVLSRDIGLESMRVQNVFRNIPESKLLPSNPDSLFSVLLVYDKSKGLQKDLELPINQRGMFVPRVIGEYLGKLIRDKIVDMVVIGASSEIDGMQFLRSLGKFQPSDDIVLKYWDSSKICSISYCGEKAVGFDFGGFKPCRPTPGKVNECSTGAALDSSLLAQAETSSQLPPVGSLCGGNAKKNIPSLIQFTELDYKYLIEKTIDPKIVPKCKNYLPKTSTLLMDANVLNWIDVYLDEYGCRFACFICKKFCKRKRPLLASNDGYMSYDIYENSKMIKLHMENDMHKQAMRFSKTVTIKSDQKYFDDVVSSFEDEERILYNSTMGAMTMAYFIAINDISFSKYESFIEAVQLLRIDLGHQQHTSSAAHDMVLVISQTFKQKFLHNLVKAKHYFSLMCDSSTNHNEAYLICHIQTIEGGHVVTHLYALMHLSNGEKGKEMAKVLTDQVDKDSEYVHGFKQYFKTYLAAIVTNGANNMIGEHNSFKSHLLNFIGRKVPNLHCMAHLLVLAIKSSLRADQALVKSLTPPKTRTDEITLGKLTYYEKFKGFGNEFFSFYVSRGHKKWLHLQKVAEDLNLVPKKLKRFIAVRWSASHYQAMLAIQHDYKALIIDLKLISIGDGNFDNSGKAIATRLHQRLTDKTYAATVREYLDFLEVYTLASKLFQESSSLLIGKVEVLYTVVEKLEKLKASVGKWLSGFLANCSFKNVCALGTCTLAMYDACAEVEFEGLLLQNHDANANILSAGRSKLYRDLIDGIGKYFKFELYSGFQLFDPAWFCFSCYGRLKDGENIRMDELYLVNQRAVYQGKEISIQSKLTSVCNFLFLTTSQCNQLTTDLNILLQSMIVDDYLRQHKTNCASEFWGVALSRDLKWTEVTRTVIQTLIVIRYSSSECERGFSLVNKIRGKDRSCMGKDTLDALVRVKSNGPKISDFNSYEYTKEFFRSGHVRADDSSYHGGRSKTENPFSRQCSKVYK